MAWIYLIITIIVLYFCWRLYFLRDPPRTPPSAGNIVSPADGYVIYFKNVRQGEVPISIKNHQVIKLSEINDSEGFDGVDGLLIGIFMTPLSVHRNRSPIDSEISFVRYFKNQYNLSMIGSFVETLFRLKKFKDQAFVLTNERVTTGFKGEKGTIYVTQIADQWINRIVSWVKPGQKMTKGEQFGMIRFGSQCDIFIPSAYVGKLEVEIGQYVYAGETILIEKSFNESEG
jgi:phosphatidylserine decarboxylase